MKILLLNYARFSLLLLFSGFLNADNFENNSLNNHGIIGLINTPSARFYDEASFAFTLYDGSPDQKLTMTSYPYDWMEASFFYTNIQNQAYGSGFTQDYKDKGFNLKFRLKEEGRFPAIAVGFNDFAGTGYYSSEYIVANYGIQNIDFSFGLATGTLNGSDNSFKNPLIYISEKFARRPNSFAGQGGSFQLGRYFSDKEISPFFGANYVFNKKFKFKIEYDTTKVTKKTDLFNRVTYPEKKSDFSFGLEYQPNKNYIIGASFERGNYFSLRFNFKSDPNETLKSYEYKPSEDIEENEGAYRKLVKNLQENGIGVKKIIEDRTKIGIEVSQFTHPNIEIIEEIIYAASKDSRLPKELKVDYSTASLRASSTLDLEFGDDAVTVYKGNIEPGFTTNTKLNFRPFLAARDGFFKYSILLENDSQYMFNQHLFFSTNLKYSIRDNFNDLTAPPVDTYPAQVRSDVKNYLRSFEKRVIIGRAEFDYFKTIAKNQHIMFSAGILEEMFSGAGFEYLYFNRTSNFAAGFEVFKVQKRDYDLRFGHIDYKNTIGSVNLYYRNHEIIPFDAKVSFGEYLAGDIGTTLEVSRSFKSGLKFGAFASFTDVSSEQYGEGSFDKGIFFNIPIYKNFISYTWRPLTKDPAARLNRQFTLYNMLVKFKPFENEWYSLHFYTLYCV